MTQQSPCGQNQLSQPQPQVMPRGRGSRTPSLQQHLEGSFSDGGETSGQLHEQFGLGRIC